MNRAYFAPSLRKTEILYKSHLKKLKKKIHLLSHIGLWETND